MPHEVADVEPVLAMLSQQNKMDSAVCTAVFLVHPSVMLYSISQKEFNFDGGSPKCALTLTLTLTFLFLLRTPTILHRTS